MYDTTTNATITGNSSGVVQLGNASTANGTLASNTTFAAGGVTTTGIFTNASAGTQTVNVANALIDTVNYSLVGGTNLSTSATIAKANVTISGVTASNKVYDTTTNASISSNGTATAVLGDASLANGSVNSSSTFNAYGATGIFTNASAGTQTVNLTTALADSTNYTLAGASQLSTSAVIKPIPIINTGTKVLDYLQAPTPTTVSTSIVQVKLPEQPPINMNAGSQSNNDLPEID